MTQMISLHELKNNLESGAASASDFEDKPMVIQDFSTGYNGNGLGLDATIEQMKEAQGLVKKTKKKKEILEISNGEENVEPADAKPAASKKKIVAGDPAASTAPKAKKAKKEKPLATSNGEENVKPATAAKKKKPAASKKKKPAAKKAKPAAAKKQAATGTRRSARLRLTAA